MLVGSARFRARPWQDDAEVAYLVPLSAPTTLGRAVMATTRARLRDCGYRRVVTAAVSPGVRDRLIDDGFEARAELESLTCDLTTPLPTLPRPRRATRGLRRRHLAQVIETDHEAFEPFWRLDADGVKEALAATPSSRWRAPRPRGATGRHEAPISARPTSAAATSRGASGPSAAAQQGLGRNDRTLADADRADTALTAYCITGRAAGHGYLQRLAVAKGWQRQGLGALLVADALHWLKRGGARSAVVNTAPDNEPALALYLRCGFTVEPPRLTVLCRDLT